MTPCSLWRWKKCGIVEKHIAESVCCPSIEEGVVGMAFIEAVVASSANNAAWTPLDYTPTQRATYGDATLNSDRGGLG